MVIKDFKCTTCGIIFEEIVECDVSDIPCVCGRSAGQVFSYGFFDGGERDKQYYREASEGFSVGIGIGEKYGRAPETKGGAKIQSEHTQEKFKEYCNKKDVRRNGVTPMTV